jgi:class 3 adenylate cyclase
MNPPVIRCVLFADLRGSAGLYESLGNALASPLVFRTVAALGSVISKHDGQLVKTLGDGLMASFVDSSSAVAAAIDMHQTIDDALPEGWSEDTPLPHQLQLQIGMACGEVVEMAGDLFGDAVNIAARLLEHCGDSETLVTSSVVESMSLGQRGQFRLLDRLQLRGRVEPVEVHILDRPDLPDLAATQFGNTLAAPQPSGLRLIWRDTSEVFAVADMPVVLGRGEQANLRIDSNLVSRSHARIVWNGGAFELSDLSSNGTHVRFGRNPEVILLRRGSCTLHGSGLLGLGAPPADASASCVRFEVLRPDNQPR